MGGTETRGTALVAGLFLGALALIFASSKRARPITRSEVNDALETLYGPLPVPLPWSALTWEPVTAGMGISTTPDEHQARNLQRIAADVLAPLMNLARMPVKVCPGGGFVPPAMFGQLAHPCPYGGHADGLALDLVAPGRSLSALLRRTCDLARFDRAVLAGDHLHIEVNPTPGNERRVFVAVPRDHLLERAS